MPQGYGPGDELEIEVDGHDYKCTVPAGVHAGESFSYAPSDETATEQGAVDVVCPMESRPGDVLKVEIDGRTERVTVPEGVVPGESFSWKSSNHSKEESMVDVTVPEGYAPGEKVLNICYPNTPPDQP